jgi:hypothetical protein
VIVRILGEGQYSVDDSERAALDTLDDALMAAVDGGDERAFATALATLTAEVRRAGSPLDDDDFAPSDLVVPFADASLDETRGLLAQPDDGGAADTP